MGCAVERPTVKVATAKIAGVEPEEVGFGGGDKSVYHVVAADGSTCRVRVGLYASIKLPQPVSCFWEK
jgi:hypothetical protein